MLNPDENLEDFVDVDGLQFDYEQYTQRWPNFWSSSHHFNLLLIISKLSFNHGSPEK